MSKENLAAIVLAAGKGTRMKSSRPKVLHRVCGQSLLERTLRAVCSAGIAKVQLVVGFGKEQLEQELERLKIDNLDVSICLQKEQLGTGDAAKAGLLGLAEKYKQVLILPGDVPLIDSEHLKQVISNSKQKLTIVSCKLEDPTGYGRVIRDSKSSVQKVVEQKDASVGELKIDEVNTSIYLVERAFLEAALKKINPQNAQKEYYLTDIVSLANEMGVGCDAICLAPEYKVMGANSQGELRKLEMTRREEIVSSYMDQGIEFEDPRSVYIDESVSIAAECFIGANTWLKGKVILGPKVSIQGNCYLRDCQIAEGTELKFGTVVEESKIGKNCVLGPYARIRPGSILEEDVRIGNFVETKKASFAKGAKANHLSYIGDASVGKNANIGAGTITCNYDGKDKHQTTIGEGAFIGSNTALVAPVVVGDGAYVGAGSVITSDVPAKSLGVARARQKVIEGWATNKKSK